MSLGGAPCRQAADSKRDRRYRLHTWPSRHQHEYPTQDEWKISIFREGGVQSLKSYWDEEGRNLELTNGLLCNLASCMYIIEYLVEDEFVSRLVAVLQKDNS